VKDIVIKLTPQGLITGRVLDEDGDPLHGVGLSAFVPKSAGSTQPEGDTGGGATNDMGEYRIAALPPGNYVVAATYGQRNSHVVTKFEPLGEQPDTEYLPTFYPGVTNPAAAATVVVEAGATAQNIDIRMSPSPVFRVRGIAISGRTGRPAHASLSLEPKGRPRSYRLEHHSAISGEGRGLFEFRGLKPGDYVLSARSMGPETGLYAAVPVTVAGSHVTGVELVLTAGAEIAGRIRESGKAKGMEVGFSSSGPSVFLRPIGDTDPDLGGRSEAINEDGSFIVKHLRPGKYVVDLWGFGYGYVRRVLLGDEDVTATGLDFTAGVPAASITVEVAHDTAEVSGVVKDKDGAELAGAGVLIYHLDAEGRLKSWPQSGTTDQRGAFRIMGVRPGDYRALATRRGDNRLEAIGELPQWIGEKAPKFTVRPDGTESIELKVVTQEELESALAKREM
jgi:protocatechuate 3,4-dioxygenase beta subunit